jgi:monoamine oxidase
VKGTARNEGSGPFCFDGTRVVGAHTLAAETKAADVVIVGAGFAGMIAARNLIREGKRVVLLEARNRAGGRVKSGVIAGRTVDVGGMWVGPTQTQLLALIKEYGFHLIPQFATGKQISMVDGKRFVGNGEDFGFPAQVQTELDATFLVEEGLHGVAEKLAAELAAITYNAPVRKISQTTDSVLVATENDVWKADHCIVAVPIPLSVRIAFEPPLTASRDALAQRMSMGSVIKWYLAYDTPFWREQGWNGLSTNFSTLGIECIDVTPAAGKPGLLVGFFDGENGLRWSSHTADERKKFVTEQMTRMFGPAAAQPIDYEDHNWPAEEWSRGCFVAWMGPGVMTSVGSSIREPHDRVHWAGTETSSKWMGYVDGAIRSGELAAEEILSSNQRRK